MQPRAGAWIRVDVTGGLLPRSATLSGCVRGWMVTFEHAGQRHHAVDEKVDRRISPSGDVFSARRSPRVLLNGRTILRRVKVSSTASHIAGDGD